MKALILCGGRSSRMGSDKGVLKKDEITWAENAINICSPLGIPVWVSVNAEQKESYALLLPNNLLIQDNPSLSVKGPLAGLLSAHILDPEQDFLLLACDMPFMQTAVLRELIAHTQKAPGHEAYLFNNSEELEPLCGIYCSVGLRKILGLYTEGTLFKHSMKFAIEKLNAHMTELRPEQLPSFMNINTHAQLNGL